MKTRVTLPAWVNFKALCELLGLDYNKAYFCRLTEFDRQTLENAIQTLKHIEKELIP